MGECGRNLRAVLRGYRLAPALAIAPKLPWVRVVINSPTIVWLRQDLRLADQPAFAAAVKRGATIIPIFIWDPTGEGDWAPGGASQWWLNKSLLNLGKEIEHRGGRLVLRRGDSQAELDTLLVETGAGAVYWCRRYEPGVIERDGQIKHELRERGIDCESFNGGLLHEPHTITNKQGRPFQVFTPYWRHCLSLDKPAVAEGSTGAMASTGAVAGFG